MLPGMHISEVAAAIPVGFRKPPEAADGARKKPSRPPSLVMLAPLVASSQLLLLLCSSRGKSGDCCSCCCVGPVWSLLLTSLGLAHFGIQMPKPPSAAHQMVGVV